MRGLALVAVLLGLALVAKPAAAQVELDGSIGPTSGLVPGGTLPDGSAATYLIEESYGRRSGPNLFHSFSRFDIPNARNAAFTGDPSIERVIGRITGGTTSDIAGSIRNTIDGADLYLLNPRGFLFSGSASLDLRGSIYLSSADNLRFDDDSVYSAIPNSSEVLSASAPSAWGFTSESLSRTIRFNRPVNFAVPPGEVLAVVGGPVIVSGLVGTTTLSAPGGTIALASRTTPGEVPVDVASLSAREAATADLGPVTVGSNAVLDVSDPLDLSPTRGRIVIRAGALTVDSSTMRADSSADAIGDAPDIDLETTRSIALRRPNPLLRATALESGARGSARGGGVRLSSELITMTGASAAMTSASGAAFAGPLEVDAGSVQLSETSRLATRATGDATAGRIAVAARTIGLSGGAQIASANEASTEAAGIEISADDALQIGSGASLVTQARAAGRGASLRIGTSSLEQSSGARIQSDAFGTGAGGALEIAAADVSLRGDAPGTDPGGVFASSFGPGDAGSVFITADHLSTEGGAQISATAEGAGRGGDVEIDALRGVSLSGASAAGPSGLFARSGLAPGTTAVGDGGRIRVHAPSVVLSDGAEISTQTFGSGTAGGIEIVAAEHVGVVGGDTSRSSINAKAAVGAGGSIAIETAELVVGSGGEISASTLDTGNSGDIEIDAERVYVGDGEPNGAGIAGIFAQSIPTEDTGIAGGDGGDIEIRASSLVALQNGGVISAQSRGEGAAGSVTIVSPVVTVTDGAAVSTQTFGSGAAGEVVLRDARNVRVEGGGTVTARSEGSGAAGSVTLDGVGELIVGAGGSISTETLADGPGGSISIDAETQVLVMNGGTISALSEGTGNAGSIAIDAGRRFSARNGGQVTTSAVQADGGDIAINASRLIYIEDGKVTTDVRAGLGSGGNITLDPEFVVLNRAELRASATGDGGNISIQTDRFVRDASSVVDASSEFGVDGEIQTTSPTVDLTSELAQLDTTFLDASSKLAAACASRSGDRGTFAVRGRARPSSPDAPLGSPGDDSGAPACDEPQP